MIIICNETCETRFMRYFSKFNIFRAWPGIWKADRQSLTDWWNFVRQEVLLGRFYGPLTTRSSKFYLLSINYLPNNHPAPRRPHRSPLRLCFMNFYLLIIPCLPRAAPHVTVMELLNAGFYRVSHRPPPVHVENVIVN